MSNSSSDPNDARATLQAELARSGGLSVLLSQAIADRVGVSPTDLEAMDLLRQSGPIPAGRLAELTGLTTAAVTGLVDRLERRGWARREPDPSDRRRVIVQPLLGHAERELEPHYAGIGRAMADLIARYADSDVALMLDFLAHSNAIVAEQIALVRAAKPAEEQPGASTAMTMTTTTGGQRRPRPSAGTTRLD